MRTMLGKNDLQKGDVLIKKADVLFTKKTGTETYIAGVQTFAKGVALVGKIGQMAFSPPSTSLKQEVKETLAGDPKLMHVAVYLGKGNLIEEGGSGLAVRPPSADLYKVYRYSDKEVSENAAELLEKFEKKRNWYSLQKFITLYAGLVFGSSHYGLFAKLRAWRAEKLPSLTGWTGLICSEAVILFYQVAARKLDKSNPIRLDSNHTSPMKLEAYMGSRGSQGWTLVGYTGVSAI